MINIVIPMAGAGKRFSDAGFTVPKPFIDIAGKPMIIRVLDNLYCRDARYILVAMRDHLRLNRETCSRIEQTYNAVFETVDTLTQGSVCTVLHARKLINNEVPLVIANSDQIIDFSFQHFIDDSINSRIDGSIVTFPVEIQDTKWSYAKINKMGEVLEVREKDPISNLATVGIYYFRKGQLFVDAAIDMIARNDRVNNEFYTCPLYNYLLKDNMSIRSFPVSRAGMHPVGTPEDLITYLNIINAVTSGESIRD
jgi:dTDP-glucose pyrophosphorylase